MSNLGTIGYGLPGGEVWGVKGVCSSPFGEFCFVLSAVLLLMNTPLWRTIYFLITAGFLFYVPFSKISHYVYFFFAAAITGRRCGWRGVRPQAGKAE